MIGGGSDDIGMASRLLHVDTAALSNGFVNRSIEVRGNVTKIPLKPHEAISSRNALAKSLYGQASLMYLFQSSFFAVTFMPFL